MIIYDDDGIGHDVVPRQAIEDIITEIQTEYNKHSDEWSYQAGLYFAIDIIRKLIKDGEKE